MSHGGASDIKSYKYILLDKAFKVWQLFLIILNVTSSNLSDITDYGQR